MADTATPLDRLVSKLAAQPRVQRIWLFGSRARGDARERSDIDIAIEAPEADRREWLEMCCLVEEEAETLLPIDLLRLEDVPEGFRERVRAEGQVLFER
jgi:predicted nucleotidyltransferase